MKIPYGDADFGKIRREGFFYVDKTPFLPVLEDQEMGYSKLILLRPRRFGKSLLVSMMDHYYDLSRADEHDELFRGLWIHDHPTPWKNKYLVLSLNFSTVSAEGDPQALALHFSEAVKSAIRTLGMRYGGRIPALATLYDEVKDYRDPAAVMNNLIGILAGTKDQLYVLIDEYDTFANALLSTGQKEMYFAVTDKAGFVRTFYRTIKAGTESGAIGRVFLTGASPILLDELMTGFNVVTNISLEPRFNAIAGFTEGDVARAVDELLRDRPDLAAEPAVGDRGRLLSMIEEHYDGYRFARRAPERIFNPIMVLSFLRDIASHGELPRNMIDVNARTDYRKLHGLWAASPEGGEERRAALETILREGAIWSELVEQFGQSQGASTTSTFVSLMYYTGMLTLSATPPEGNQYRFEPPNRVLRELGWDHYMRLLQDLEGIRPADPPMGAALRSMARDGDIEPFLRVFQEGVLSVLGLKDLRRYDEKSLKMLLIGTILLSNVFHVLSEKEFAQGYTDLFLGPTRSMPTGRFAWMLELKYLHAGATDAEIDAVFAQAEEQLRRYEADPHLVPMLTRGLVLKAGTLVFVACKRVEYRALHAATPKS